MEHRHPKRRRCSRTARSLTIADAIKYNPDLNDSQAHRAHLTPPPSSLAGWDALANALAGLGDANVAYAAAALLRRKGPVDLTKVQPYSDQCTAAEVGLAVEAGFFVFGSEFRHPTARLPDRSFLNFELAGEGASGDRIVFDASDASVSGFNIGRKTLRRVVDACSPSAPCLVDCWAAEAAHGYAEKRKLSSGDGPVAAVLTVNAAFGAVHRAIVRAHGVDWMGFERVADAHFVGLSRPNERPLS